MRVTAVAGTGTAGIQVPTAYESTSAPRATAAPAAAYDVCEAVWHWRIEGLTQDHGKGPGCSLLNNGPAHANDVLLLWNCMDSECSVRLDLCF